MSENHWFTSDTHFGHKNIIEYAGRPFSSVEEMDEALIERWNTVVGLHDHAYFTGDLAFATPERIREILNQLNGFIHCIRGNHDKPLDTVVRSVDRPRNIVDYCDYKEIKIAKQKIVLFHFPIAEWNGAHHGTWHLHGHQHGNGAIPTIPRMDIGVDCHDYRPISFDEVAEVMATREWEKVSHH